MCTYRILSDSQIDTRQNLMTSQNENLIIQIIYLEMWSKSTSKGIIVYAKGSGLSTQLIKIHETLKISPSQRGV